MRHLGLLIVRVIVGGLMAGHGAQKLFGWFGGHGLQGTAGWLESMRLRPGRRWALLAGGSEFGGGVLTALGLLDPIGPVNVTAAMGMAIAKVHWGKPIWANAGGAELPLLNMAVAGALILSGPGRLSLDRLLGIRLPRWAAVPALLIAGATIAYGVRISTQASAKPDALAPQSGIAPTPAATGSQPVIVGA